MPNWCTTSYALTGEPKEVDSLYRMMHSLEKRHAPLVPNGFGKRWLGCLVSALGESPMEHDCRGQWSNLRVDGDGVLHFDTEHAWSRPEEMEVLIARHFPSLSVFFLEEELGMDVFQTNDAEGRFFPQQVIIDDEKRGMEYFTECEALSRLSVLAGKPLSSWEEAVAFTDEHNDREDEASGEDHIWLHRAKLC